MIFMGHRGTKEGHDPISGKLVDRPLVLVDLVHQDLETAVHDLMDLFRVKLLRQSGIAGQISEEDCYVFAFTSGRRWVLF